MRLREIQIHREQRTDFFFVFCVIINISQKKSTIFFKKIIIIIKLKKKKIVESRFAYKFTRYNIVLPRTTPK